MVKAAPAPDGLESGTDFPIVCEVCLGPNPYIRMIKSPNAKECKVSGRVFTSFRWRPGASARYKETVISPEVARAKGVCQCCLMDMEYNLPVGVRDALLKGTEEVANLPQSGVNQTYHYDQVAKASREDVEVASPHPSYTVDVLCQRPDLGAAAARHRTARWRATSWSKWRATLRTTYPLPCASSTCSPAAWKR